MSGQFGFISAICERPHDDAPRLIYADWLEERDDPRGEFIRVQCELGLSKDAEHCPKCGEHWRWQVGLEELSQCGNGHRWEGRTLRNLRERERELLWATSRERHPKLGERPNLFFWAGPAVEIVPDGARYTDHLTFRRGFIDSIETTHDLWCGTPCRQCEGFEHVPGDCIFCNGTGRLNAHGPEIVKCQPVTKVKFTYGTPPTDDHHYWLAWARREAGLPEMEPEFASGGLIR